MYSIHFLTLDSDPIFFIAMVLLVSAFIHGSVGFGFPMISTPILAMGMDLSSAIMVTLLPTILLNTMSIRNAKGWKRLVQKHFPFAVLALSGSMLGTLILVVWDAHWMKVLLALMIVLYLALEKLEVDLEFMNRYKRTVFVSFSLIGGILGGITNIMLPILIMYALLKRYSKEESIVFMNLSFLLGKLSQTAIFLLMGHWLSGEMLLYTTIPALGGFLIGVKIKKSIPDKTYTAIVKVLLLLIAIAIVVRYANAAG